MDKFRIIKKIFIKYLFYTLTKTHEQYLTPIKISIKKKIKNLSRQQPIFFIY
jgi:hypothetical protein